MFTLSISTPPSRCWRACCLFLGEAGWGPRSPQRIEDMEEFPRKQCFQSLAATNTNKTLSAAPHIEGLWEGGYPRALTTIHNDSNAVHISNGTDSHTHGVPSAHGVLAT